MHKITCKNCHKEFDGIMGWCGVTNACDIYRCTYCKHEETIEREPINNICLGYKSGIDLTTERLQLCIKLEGFDEMRTTMSPEEYEVMVGLVKRLFGKAQEK